MCSIPQKSRLGRVGRPHQPYNATAPVCGLAAHPSKVLLQLESRMHPFLCWTFIGKRGLTLMLLITLFRLGIFAEKSHRYLNSHTKGRLGAWFKFSS